MDPEFIHGVGWVAPAIVLWHDCQIDKSHNQGRSPSKAFAGIAPILPLTTLSEELRGRVRAHEHHSYFHLPEVPKSDLGGVAESYVNLRYIWSVRQSVLRNRLVTLSPEARLSLYEQMFVFFTRQRLDCDPTCPSCGTPVPLIQSSDARD